MKQIQEILESGMYEEIIPEKKQTIRDLLSEMSLSEELTFGILLNGNKADLDTIINEDDKIVIIPHIKGGK